MPDPATIAAPHAQRRVHIIGAGPVGLVMTAMLQSMEGFSIRLYEKRPSYIRTRMVKLASYLTADSISAYCADEIDGESVSAIFEPSELEKGLKFRRSIDRKLFGLLQEWNRGFCRLNDIETGLSSLIAEGGKSPVERVQGAVSVEQAMAMLAPHEIMIDCTGANSMLRDQLVPPTDDESESAERNTFKIRLEYACNVTFLYGRPYSCNEYCKYYKNRGNGQYKFIPAVDRIAQDAGTTHVFGIVNISAEDYQAMPGKCNGDYLREHFPDVAASMDRFIQQVQLETNGQVIGEIDVVRIPLNLYRARNATSRQWHPAYWDGNKDGWNHPFSSASVFLVGDSAIGSPYFQSISLGFECAMFLADLLGQRMIMTDVFDRYENLMYKQWLRVYMRSKIIKHNKDIFERLDDTFGLLERLHIY
jgi:2-polyprenyl-6-methoxyphenol hydroxylase-like FAD-dependent oxidoreductase